MCPSRLPQLMTATRSSHSGTTPKLPLSGSSWRLASIGQTVSVASGSRGGSNMSNICAAMIRRRTCRRMWPPVTGSTNAWMRPRTSRFRAAYRPPTSSGRLAPAKSLAPTIFPCRSIMISLCSATGSAVTWPQPMRLCAIRRANSTKSAGRARHGPIATARRGCKIPTMRRSGSLIRAASTTVSRSAALSMPASATSRIRASAMPGRYRPNCP